MSDLDGSTRTIPRVSGPSSYLFALVGRWLLVVWLLSCLAMVIVVLAKPSDLPTWYFALFIVVLACFALSFICMGAALGVMNIQVVRERNAGYTWLADTYVNLPQVDPVSRVVIREAGEDFLTTAERRERIAEARAGVLDARAVAGGRR
jgi:hypothetical protein